MALEGSFGLNADFAHAVRGNTYIGEYRYGDLHGVTQGDSLEQIKDMLIDNLELTTDEIISEYKDGNDLEMIIRLNNANYSFNTNHREQNTKPDLDRALQLISDIKHDMNTNLSKFEHRHIGEIIEL